MTNSKMENARRGGSLIERMNKKLRVNLFGTLIIALPMIGFVAFQLVPMIISAIMSFSDLHSYDISQAKWIGFQNFERLWNDTMIPLSIENTLLFCINVPLNVIITVFLANMVSKGLKGEKFYRVVFFLPQVCSGVAVTLMWQWIFNEFGMVNTVLGGIGVTAVPFMTQDNWFVFAVIVISIWKTGTNVIILESAFANVNKTLQEAARIDGASEMSVFWHVTFPQLTPAIFYVWTTRLIAGLQEQTIMQIITTNGVGPGSRAVTLVYYIYRMAFTNMASQGMGMSCALSWVTALFILLITRINFRLSKYWVSYDE